MDFINAIECRLSKQRVDADAAIAIGKMFRHRTSGCFGKITKFDDLMVAGFICEIMGGKFDVSRKLFIQDWQPV